MQYRKLGKSRMNISEISLGTWQVGGKWGSGFDDNLADAIINSAIDQGVNFIDTADIYEAGMSESAVGRVVNSRREEVFVATKCGRALQPHENDSYTPKAMRDFVESSLKRMKLERIDLVQLHCPPIEVYYRPEIFGTFQRLQDEGKIRSMGVSVEKVEEGMKAIEYENVTSIQIIYNMFRQRPHEKLFELASDRDVGIIIRVPLASGLLTGQYTKNTTFGKNDHRFFNREGAGFDKGETFSGIPYETGLQAVNELKELFPEYNNLAPVALKWVLQSSHVTTVIPGASKVEQVQSNLKALDIPKITKEQMQKIDEIYGRLIKKEVHQLW
ncbi:MAG: aldo/keto reductase [Saprospiraceae bacterium]|nr:aldo/keto reductase [Saprospiraceae bacterium]|tara:strand:- start:4063 stop:5049 length:987 start_codon:yes stop_codon:yes gene_type:complete